LRQCGGVDRFIEPAHAFTMDVEEEVRLGGVVMVDQPLGGIQPACDVVDAGPLETGLHEALGGAVEDRDVGASRCLGSTLARGSTRAVRLDGRLFLRVG
jgi:hypothetical protein